MTEIVHIANTAVEFELATTSPLPIEFNLSHSPLSLQLQFLPLLYAEPDDLVAVTSLPDEDFIDGMKHSFFSKREMPRLHLVNEITPFLNKKCHSWGPSLQVKKWADARQMKYDIPNWNCARQINSKAFSFDCFHLEGAQLVHNESDLREWLKKDSETKVLKTCFGLSGIGNKQIDEQISFQEILAFCQKEWKQKRPLVGEPWVDRQIDFSTQWFIHSDQTIEWVGTTRFETDHRGIYQGTLAGPENLLFKTELSFLKEHRLIALNALQVMAEMNFFGPVGVDALVYHNPITQKNCLYPLVEINGRQTMSLVAVRLQQRLCPEDLYRLSYKSSDSSTFSLLPTQLVNGKGKTVHFRKGLVGEHVLK